MLPTSPRKIFAGTFYGLWVAIPAALLVLLLLAWMSRPPRRAVLALKRA
jgi:hypothetical protein